MKAKPLEKMQLLGVYPSLVFEPDIEYECIEATNLPDHDYFLISNRGEIAVMKNEIEIVKETI